MKPLINDTFSLDALRGGRDAAHHVYVESLNTEWQTPASVISAATGKPSRDVLQTQTAADQELTREGAQEAYAARLRDAWHNSGDER